MDDALTASHATLRLAFLGAWQERRRASWIDEVTPRADLVLPSRAAWRGRRWLATQIDTVSAGVPLDLRIVGYSWGAWTAAQLVVALFDERVTTRFDKERLGTVRLGLLDPVATGRRAFRLPDDPRLQAWSVFQRNGCWRGCPGPSAWYAGQHVERAENRDLTEAGRDQPLEGGVPAAHAPDHLQLGYRAWGGWGLRIARVLEGTPPW